LGIGHRLCHLPEPRCVDRPRCDHVGPHDGAVLDRQLAGEPDEPRLGRAVRRVALGADEAEHGRGVDDAAPPVVLHHRDRGPARPSTSFPAWALPSSWPSPTAMRAPPIANRSAAARPCPDAAPVMSATLPASRPVTAGTLTSRLMSESESQPPSLPKYDELPV